MGAIPSPNVVFGGRLFYVQMWSLWTSFLRQIITHFRHSFYTVLLLVSMHNYSPIAEVHAVPGYFPIASFESITSRW